MEKLDKYFLKKEMEIVSEFENENRELIQGLDLGAIYFSFFERLYKILPGIYIPLYGIEYDESLDLFIKTTDEVLITKDRYKISPGTVNVYKFLFTKLLTKIRFKDGRHMFPLSMTTAFIKSLAYRNINVGKCFLNDPEVVNILKEYNVDITDVDALLYLYESFLNNEHYHMANAIDTSLIDYEGNRMISEIAEKLKNYTDEIDVKYDFGDIIDRIIIYTHKVADFIQSADDNKLLNYFKNTFEYINSLSNPLNKLFKYDVIHEITFEDKGLFKSLDYKFVDGTSFEFVNSLVLDEVRIADYKLNDKYDKLTYLSNLLSLTSYVTDEPFNINSLRDNIRDLWFLFSPYMFLLLPLVDTDVYGSKFVFNFSDPHITKDGKSNHIKSFESLTYPEAIIRMMKSSMFRNNLPSPKLNEIDKYLSEIENNPERIKTIPVLDIFESGLILSSINSDLLDRIDKNLETTDDIEIYVLFCAILELLLNIYASTTIITAKEVSAKVDLKKSSISFGNFFDLVDDEGNLNIDRISEFIADAIVNPVYKSNSRLIEINKDLGKYQVIYVLLREFMDKEIDVDKYTDKIYNIVPKGFLTKSQVRDILEILDSLVTELIYSA